MTELELDFLKRLLVALKEQYSRLGETIAGIEEVLEFERSTHTTLKVLEKRDKTNSPRGQGR